MPLLKGGKEEDMSLSNNDTKKAIEIPSVGLGKAILQQPFPSWI